MRLWKILSRLVIRLDLGFDITGMVSRHRVLLTLEITAEEVWSFSHTVYYVVLGT